MSRGEKILDDMARMAGGAAGLMNDAGKHFGTMVRSYIDEWAQGMDLVPREDFDRLEAMLAASREAQNTLEKRVAALEEKLKK